MFIFFFVHLLACIFFFISNLEIGENPQTWMTLLTFEDAQSGINAYIASASWSFTTIASVGYGDIYPVTDLEKLFGIFAMMVACGVFSTIVGILSGLFDKNDQIVADLQ